MRVRALVEIDNLDAEEIFLKHLQMLCGGAFISKGKIYRWARKSTGGHYKALVENNKVLRAAIVLRDALIEAQEGK